MADIDPNEPPLFDLEDIFEPDVEGDDSRGGLVLEGVNIPFELSSSATVGCPRARWRRSASAATSCTDRRPPRSSAGATRRAAPGSTSP
jgi:hypothetical protein